MLVAGCSIFHMPQTSSFVCRWTDAVASYYVQYCSGLPLLMWFIKSLSEYDSIFKYADDTTLLVPKCSSVSLKKSFNMCSNGPTITSFKLIFPKTKELVFNIISPHHDPCRLLNNSQLQNFSENVVGLGIFWTTLYITHLFSAAAHVEHILSVGCWSANVLTCTA